MVIRMKKDIHCKVSPSGRKKLEYKSKSKSKVKLPLIGKTIYLDVKEAKHVKRLQADLKTLGATIEEFVSRDINYLITSQARPKLRPSDPYDYIDAGSPTPSPFNCDPSPSPGTGEDRRVTSVTRGKALLEKARVNTRQTSTLLDNAEKWGVKIIQLELAFKWIGKELKKLPKIQTQPKKSSKCVSSYKLFKSPYVKCETSNFCYRPFHLELEHWPHLSLETPRGSCPFDGTLIKCGDESREERGELLAAQVDIPSEGTPQEEKDNSGSNTNKNEKPVKKSDADVSISSVPAGRVLTAGELRRRKEQQRRQERKRGYCECCHVKYEDLDKHIVEEQHRRYVKDKSNYQTLDNLIHAGPSTAKFLQHIVTSALVNKAAINKQSQRTSSTTAQSSPKLDENVLRRSPRKSPRKSSVDMKKSVETAKAKKSPAPQRLFQRALNDCRSKSPKNPKLGAQKRSHDIENDPMENKRVESVGVLNEQMGPRCSPRKKPINVTDKDSPKVTQSSPRKRTFVETYKTSPSKKSNEETVIDKSRKENNKSCLGQTGSSQQELKACLSPKQIDGQKKSRVDSEIKSPRKCARKVLSDITSVSPQKDQDSYKNISSVKSPTCTKAVSIESKVSENIDSPKSISGMKKNHRNESFEHCSVHETKRLDSKSSKETSREKSKEGGNKDGSEENNGSDAKENRRSDLEFTVMHVDQGKFEGRKINDKLNQHNDIAAENGRKNDGDGVKVENSLTSKAGSDLKLADEDKRLRKKKTGSKFWSYVVEPVVETNVVDGDDSVPKELRLLKADQGHWVDPGEADADTRRFRNGSVNCGDGKNDDGRELDKSSTRRNRESPPVAKSQDRDQENVKQSFDGKFTNKRLQNLDVNKELLRKSKKRTESKMDGVKRNDGKEKLKNVNHDDEDDDILLIEDSVSADLKSARENDDEKKVHTDKKRSKDKHKERRKECDSKKFDHVNEEKKREPKSGKFWSYVVEPIESPFDSVIDESLPKELRKLKQNIPQWFSGDENEDEARQSRFRSASNTRSRDSSVDVHSKLRAKTSQDGSAERDSDTMEVDEADDDEMEGSDAKHSGNTVDKRRQSCGERKSKEIHRRECIDEKGENMNKKHKSMKQKCKNLNEKGDNAHDNEIKKGKSKPKGGKFWSYVVEPAESPFDSVIDESLPKELRTLKQNIPQWFSGDENEDEGRRSRFRSRDGSVEIQSSCGGRASEVGALCDTENTENRTKNRDAAKESDSAKGQEREIIEKSKEFGKKIKYVDASKKEVVDKKTIGSKINDDSSVRDKVKSVSCKGAAKSSRYWHYVEEPIDLDNSKQSDPDNSGKEKTKSDSANSAAKASKFWHYVEESVEEKTEEEINKDLPFELKKLRKFQVGLRLAVESKRKSRRDEFEAERRPSSVEQMKNRQAGTKSEAVLVKKGFKELMKGKDREGNDFEACLSGTSGENDIEVTIIDERMSHECSFEENMKESAEQLQRINKKRKERKTNDTKKSDHETKSSVKQPSKTCDDDESFYNNKSDRKHYRECTSDIPSDFVIRDENGEALMFTKTLAERIKERSCSRKASVGSYNISHLSQSTVRSRSNSLSSNVSGNGEKSTKSRKKLTINSEQKRAISKLLEKSPTMKKTLVKNKSGSSIASAKVVNKYKNQRYSAKMLENNSNGYQGDDESESKKLSKESVSRNGHQKDRSGKGEQIKVGKYWVYVPIREETSRENAANKTNKTLPKELRLLADMSAGMCSDLSDSDADFVRSTRQSSNITARTSKFTSVGSGHACENVDTESEVEKSVKNEVEKIKKSNDERSRSGDCVDKRSKRKVFWEYVPVADDTLEPSENQEKLKTLPKLVQKLLNSSNDLSTLSDNETRLSRSGIVRRSVVESDSDMNAEREQKMANKVSRTDHRKTDTPKTGNKTYHAVRSSVKNDEGNENSGNESDLPGVRQLENTEKRDKQQKNRKHKVFWAYEVVTDDDDDDDDIDKNLPKELRILKDSQNKLMPLDEGKSRRSRAKFVDPALERIRRAELRNERKNSDSELSNDREQKETEKTCKDISKTRTEAVSNRDEKSGKTGSFDSESMLGDGNGTGTGARNTYRSGDRKSRQKFWVYEEVSESSEDKSEAQKHLPKELQQLKCNWNTLNADGSTNRRSLSRNSDSSVDRASSLSKSKSSKAVFKKDLSDKDRVLKPDNASKRTTSSQKELHKKENGKSHCTIEISSPKKQTASIHISQCMDSSSRECSPVKKSKLVITSPRRKASKDSTLGSQSPVFKKSSSGNLKTSRRSSPVFNKSPGSLKSCSVNSDNGFVVTCSPVKRNVARNIHSIQSDCASRQTEEGNISQVKDLPEIQSNQSYSLEQIAGCTTPDRKVQSKEPSSGYSATPRSERHKKWKRKLSESDTSVHGSQNRKKRKLDSLKYEIEEKMPQQEACYLKKRTKILSPKQCRDKCKDISEVCRDVDHSLKKNDGVDSNKRSKMSRKKDQETLCNSQDKEECGSYDSQSHDMNNVESFSLKWEPVSYNRNLFASGGSRECQKSSQGERVRLNQSWNLLSERSVNRLLSSEDDHESFAGFVEDEQDASLPSDLSFEQCSEVDMQNSDQNYDWIVEDKGNDCDNEHVSDVEGNIENYVPSTFSSPGKASESSWIDACEDYIDRSLKQGPDSSFRVQGSSMYCSFNSSPRKSPFKKSPFKSPSKGVSRSSTARSGFTTPQKCKKPATDNDGMVCKVDKDIEFNFGSPQKDCMEFSPLHSVNGVVEGDMSPVLKRITSTPITLVKKTRSQQK